MGPFCTSSLLVGVLYLSDGGANAAAVAGETLFDFSINEGPLSAAVTSVSEQSDTVILVDSNLIEGLRTKALKGEYTLGEVLQKLAGPVGLAAHKVSTSYVILAAGVSDKGGHPAPENQPGKTSADEGGLYDAEPKPPIETIEVTGFRTSNWAAIGAKYVSNRIVDGINQDTITLLPDLTVADVARRIPGVASISATGAATPRQIQGNQNVLIRGMDANYSQTTIDGLPFASARQTDRAANLALLPPTAISRLETVKTLTADMDPHGITGQFNLITTSALGNTQPKRTVRLSIGDNSTAGKVLDKQGQNVRADLVYQLLPQDNLGLSFAASYEQFFSTSYNERPGGQADTYYFFSPDPSQSSPVDRYADSDGLPAARRNQLYLFESEQTRISALSKLEWQFSETSRIEATAATFEQRETEVRHEHLVIASNNTRPVSQTQTEGDWLSAKIEAGYVSQPEKSRVRLINARFISSPNTNHSFELAGAFSSSTVDEKRLMSKFSLGQGGEDSGVDLPFAYEVSAQGVAIDISDPAIANDPASYSISYIRERLKETAQKLYHAEGKYSFFQNPSGLGLGMEVGASFRHIKQSFDREYIEGDVFDTSACDTQDITTCPYVNFTDYVELERFSTADPDVQFLLVNDDLLRADWAAQGYTLTTDRTDKSVDTDYLLGEEYTGFWLRLFHQTQSWRFEAGLRYDHASAMVDHYRRDERLPDEPKILQYVPISTTYESEFLLPSVFLTYEAGENTLIRGAFTRTIGRPNISDLTTFGSIGVPEGDEVIISRGNPDLKPLVSDNLDVSLEYYFDDNRSLASLGLFYKSVSDLIFLRSSILSDYELDGEILTATILEPVNSSEASLYGLEASIRLDLEHSLSDVFQGLLVETNVTWTGSTFTYFDIDGTPRSPGGWINQPELIFNAQLSYERGRFAGKIAYNYISEYLSNILSESGDLYDTYAKDRGVIDLQLRYAFSDQVTLLGEVQNLTKEPIIFYRRFPFGDLLASRTERGRVAWLGFSWAF